MDLNPAPAKLVSHWTDLPHIRLMMRTCICRERRRSE